MSIWRRIFSPGRAAETVDALRAKIERLRALLDRNNLVLELIAQATESLGGDLLFDFQYLRRFAAQLEDAVQHVVIDLNEITDHRYLALGDAFERIRAGVSEVLERRPSAPLTPYVLPLDEVDRDLSEAVGEKMACLGEIRRRLTCQVPDGFVITARACMRVFEEIRLNDHLQEVSEAPNDETPLARRVEARLSRLVLEGRIPGDIARAIRKALSQVAQGGGMPDLFAVRSSAIGEEKDLSFAGLHETCLGVPAADVPAAYQRVLASLFRAPAIVYQTKREEPWQQALMAVGCIRMVPARSSGVVYTLDPNDPQRDVLLVSAAPGLGRLVVEGGGRIDRFVMSRTLPYRVLSREIPRKDQMYRVDPQGGVRASPVPADRRDLPAVSDDFLVHLAEVALKIERYMKSAQDIEWAQDERGELVILQTRPLPLQAETPGIDRQAMTATQRHRVLLAGRGTIACRGIGYGRAVVVQGGEKPDDLPKDFVLVTRLSSPHLAELVPYANAVIADVGASTGHLATITREFRVPALVDVEIATRVLAEGPEITVDAEENVVYEGRVEELLQYQARRQSPFEDSREFRVLRRMLKRIAPLNLKDPQARNFAPRNCQTYHDVIRFAHEKAVEHFLEGRPLGPAAKGSHWAAVDMAVPLDLVVIDIGGGLEAPPAHLRCTPEQITCLPLRALLEGLNAPGAWRTEPADMDLGSFLSSAVSAPPLADANRGLPAGNLAIASDHYLNLNLHLGYHFNQIDAFVCEDRNDNYIRFRFVGGLTEMARRLRRTKMIAIILERQDFVTDLSSDFLVARLKKFDRETMLQRMRMLGLLIGFTRQMDVQMRGDAMIADGVDEFLQAFHNTQLPS